jgi:hypothetical protein
VFGKTQIKCFYQAILNMISTQDKLLFIQIKTKQHQKSTRILLILYTLFKLHTNQMKQHK